MCCTSTSADHGQFFTSRAIAGPTTWPIRLGDGELVDDVGDFARKRASLSTRLGDGELVYDVGDFARGFVNRRVGEAASLRR